MKSIKIPKSITYEPLIFPFRDVTAPISADSDSDFAQALLVTCGRKYCSYFSPCRWLQVDLGTLLRTHLAKRIESLYTYSHIFYTFNFQIVIIFQTATNIHSNVQWYSLKYSYVASKLYFSHKLMRDFLHQMAILGTRGRKHYFLYLYL